MPITTLYAGLLGLLLLILSIRVINVRRGPNGTSLGDGGDPDMARRIRAQGNLVEYGPLCLIMLGLIESAGYADWVIHALGIALTLGRYGHGYALSKPKGSVIGRSGGMVLTLSVLTIASGLCVWTYLA